METVKSQINVNKTLQKGIRIFLALALTCQTGLVSFAYAGNPPGLEKQDLGHPTPREGVIPSAWEEIHGDANALDVVQQGRVEVVVIDDFLEGTTRSRIHTYLITQDGEHHQLHFPPGHAAMHHLMTGDVVRVVGKKLVMVRDSVEEAHIALSEDPGSIEILHAGLDTTSGESFLEVSGAVDCSASPVPQSLCRQSTAIILANNNGQASPMGLATAETRAVEMDSYYQENSFGKTWLTGLEDLGESADVYGIYNLNVSSTCEFFTFWAAARDAAQADSGIDFSQYRRVMVVGPYQGCSFGGIAGLGSRWSVVLSSSLGVMVHEFGHNLGIHHAGRPTNCDFASEGPVGCSVLEYGDAYDVMGSSSLPGHFNSPHKEKSLFFAQENVVSYPFTGSVYYNLSPLEDPSLGTQAIKIAYDANSNYYISYRRDPNLNQIEVHYAPSFGSRTLRITGLNPGESYTDTRIGINVAAGAINLDGPGFSVEVTNDVAPCTHLAPSVVISPDFGIGDSGDILEFSVHVTNNDPDCGTEAFLLNAVTPLGWTSSFSEGSGLVIPQGATVSTNLQVQVVDTESGVFDLFVTATNYDAPGFETTTTATAYIGDVNVPPYFGNAPFSVRAVVGQAGSFSVEVRDYNIEEFIDLSVTSLDAPVGLDTVLSEGPLYLDDDGDGVPDSTKVIYEVFWPTGVTVAGDFHLTLTASDRKAESSPHDITVHIEENFSPQISKLFAFPTPGLVGSESEFLVFAWDPNDDTLMHSVALAGDFNGDGVITEIDVTLIDEFLLEGTPYDPEFDVNADNLNNHDDLLYVQAHVNTFFPSGFALVEDEGETRLFDTATAYRWIPTAGQIGDYDFMFKVMDPPGLKDAQLLHYICLCDADADCDDGFGCTLDFCDPQDAAAGAGGCVNKILEYGDVNRDGVVGAGDVQCVLEGFQGVFVGECTLGDVDIAPCGGDGVVDAGDITAVLDASRGVAACPGPCD